MIFGIFPYVKITSLNRDANSATNAVRHVEAEGQPSKKSKKCGGKGSVAPLKESIQLGRVSQDCPPRNSILRQVGKLRSNHTVKFSKGTQHLIQNLGKKESIARKLCKSANLKNAIRVRQNSRTGHFRKLCNNNIFARSQAWDLAKHVCKLKARDEATFHPSSEARVMRAPSW